MSDEDLTVDDPDNDTPTITKLRALVKSLQGQVKDLGEKASTGETAARDLAFYRAGVDPEDPKAKWFVKGYDGDLETEAVKAAAIEAGFITAEDSPPPPADDSAALGRIVDASAPRVPTGEPSLDDRIKAAERDGDYATSRLLKHQKVSAQVKAL